MRAAFIHGAGCTGDAFRAQRDAFEDGEIVELLGRGASAGGPSSISEFADAVDRQLAELAFSGILVGHSMGGAIALELALRKPSYVRGVVTICSGARLRVAAALLERLESDFDGACRTLAQSWFADQRPELVGLALDMLTRVGAAQTAADFRACDGFDVTDRLIELPVPLLAIGGSDDRFTPAKFATFLADRVPDGDARILQGAGHCAMLERPDETNALLRAFNARVHGR